MTEIWMDDSHEQCAVRPGGGSATGKKARIWGRWRRTVNEMNWSALSARGGEDQVVLDCFQNNRHRGPAGDTAFVPCSVCPAAAPAPCNNRFPEAGQTCSVITLKRGVVMWRQLTDHRHDSQVMDTTTTNRCCHQWELNQTPACTSNIKRSHLSSPKLTSLHLIRHRWTVQRYMDAYRTTHLNKSGLNFCAYISSWAHYSKLTFLLLLSSNEVKELFRMLKLSKRQNCLNFPRYKMKSAKLEDCWWKLLTVSPDLQHIWQL